MTHRPVRLLVLVGFWTASGAVACGASDRKVSVEAGGAGGEPSTGASAGADGDAVGSGGQEGEGGARSDESSDTSGTAGEAPSSAGSGGQSTAATGGQAPSSAGSGGQSTAATGGQAPSSAGSGGQSTAATGGTAGSSGSGPAPECTTGEARCVGDTPQACVAGEWVDGEPCSGATPVCTNGLCGAFHLFGGMVTVGGFGAGGSIRLVDHGLEYTTTSCGVVDDQNVCVTGGIRP